MATHAEGLHFPGMAGPETKAPTQDSEQQPETRDYKNNTDRRSRARQLFDTVGVRLALVAAGIGVGVGGTAYAMGERNHQTPGALPERPPAATAEQSPTPTAGVDSVTTPIPKTPETQEAYHSDDSIFEKDLLPEQITLPKSVDADTYTEITKNVGAALQYYVNHDNKEGIEAVVPGGSTNPLQPEQYQLRADFIPRYRQTGQGDPDDPNAQKNLAWGFVLEPVDTEASLEAKYGKPKDNETGFDIKVIIRTGDYLNKSGRTWQVDSQWKETITIHIATRVGVHRDGTWKQAQTPPGMTGRGWGITAATRMQDMSPVIAKNLPPGWTEVPPLFIQTD